jgi:hypothetical protein
MDRAIEKYLDAGMPGARPTSEGVTKNLERKAASPNDTINIHSDAFAYGSPRIRGSRNVITGNVSPCVVVAAVTRDGGERLGFMAHLWAHAQLRLENAAEAMSMIAGMGPTEMIVFGGEDQPESAAIAAVIEGFLEVEDPDTRVVGRDILRGFAHRSLTIGIDTSAERPFFVPTNWRLVDIVSGDACAFGYEGAHVAPLCDFLELARRE